MSGDPPGEARGPGLPEPRRAMPRPAIGVVFGAFAAGFLLVSVSTPGADRRMLPWIVGRGMGLAAYLTLWALVIVGTWFSHPWRLRVRVLHPSLQLRFHALLAAGTLVLVAGHVVALVADRYARVGVQGALVPGLSGYRPLAVALGTVALYLGLAVGATAALAGRLVRGRHWLPIHRLAVLVFACTWFHGVLAGSDTPALRVLYALSGVAVVAMTATRILARPPEARGGAPGEGISHAVSLTPERRA